MSVMLGTWFSHFSAFVKQLVEDLDLFDLECKLGMFRVRLSLYCAFESVFVQVTKLHDIMKFYTVRLYKCVFHGEA